MAMNWPFGLVNARQPWDVVVRGGLLVLIAKSVEGDQTTAGCTVTVACEGDTCIACQSLKGNTMLKDIVERAGRSMSSENGRSLNYEYMTMKQTEERARAATASVEVARLKTLNIRRQALRIGRKLEGFKKVMMFLGQNDICGVRRVLGQSLKDGKSPFAILGTLQAAFEGRYHARGHNEDDLDLSILVMRVGGPSLLYALSKALGLPSLTSVYVEMRKRHMAFTPCASLKFEILDAAVIDNLKAVVEVYRGRDRLFQIQVDEIAQEKRARHYQKNDTILGLCVEHTDESDVNFRNISHVERVANKLKLGEIHLGSENTVLSLQGLGSSPHHSLPVVSFSSCKSSNPGQQELVIRTILRACAEDARFRDVIRVVAVATDGDSVRRGLLNKMTGDPSVPAAQSLTGLELMHPLRSLGGWVESMDPKHNVKRWRTRLYSEKGVLIAAGRLALNRQTLLRLFTLWAPGTDFTQLFNPADKQNVPLAVKMAQMIVAVGAADKNTIEGLEANPTMQALLEDVQVLAAIMEPLLDVLLNPEKTIAQLLRGLACVSVLLLFLFRENRTSFIPGQLYHDMQATIRAKFHVVSEAQLRCPFEKLYTWMIGTDGLENLYAVTRTLTHARNVDAKELSERFSAAIGVEQVFEKKPEWKRVSKRLNGTLDHTNPRHWDDNGPANNTDVREVDVSSCWYDGSKDAIVVLQCHPSFQATLDSGAISELAKLGVTTFLPFGPDGVFPGLRVEDLADAEGSGDSSEEQDHAREGVQRAPSATDGAVDNPSVELDAFLQENESGGNEGSPYCDVDGKQVHKQRVLTELMGSQFGSASRDRLKRVRGPLAGRSSVSDLPGVGAGDDQYSGIGNTNARSLGIGDPFAMMVATRPGQYTLGLFSCTSAPREESREGTGEVIKGRLMKLRRTREEWEEDEDEEEDDEEDEDEEEDEEEDDEEDDDEDDDDEEEVEDEGDEDEGDEEEESGKGKERREVERGRGTKKRRAGRKSIETSSEDVEERVRMSKRGRTIRANVRHIDHMP